MGDYPSDHLPIAAVLEFEPRGSDLPTSAVPSLVPVPIPPAAVDGGIRSEWIEISRLSPQQSLLRGTSKKDRGRLLRDQRDLENAFLEAVGDEVAKLLVVWRSDSTAAARSLVEQAVYNASISAASRGEATSETCPIFDPGGGCPRGCDELDKPQLPRWAGC